MRKKPWTSQWISLSTRIQQIEELQQKLEVYRKFEKYEHYFSKIKKRTRCCYIVELRRLVLKELLFHKLTISECASILHVSHSALIHVQTIKNFKEVEIEVRDNYKRWFHQEVYPVTNSYEKSRLYRKEWGTLTPYYLKSIYE